MPCPPNQRSGITVSAEFTLERSLGQSNDFAMLPPTKLGQIATAVLAVLLLGCCAASAERCVITSGPHYHLVADVVSWSMKVESGRRCLRGVRFADVELERMVLVSP